MDQQLCWNLRWKTWKRATRVNYNIIGPQDVFTLLLLLLFFFSFIWERLPVFSVFEIEENRILLPFFRIWRIKKSLPDDCCKLVPRSAWGTWKLLFIKNVTFLKCRKCLHLLSPRCFSKAETLRILSGSDTMRKNQCCGSVNIFFRSWSKDL